MNRFFKIFKRSVLDTEDFMEALGSSKIHMSNGYDISWDRSGVFRNDMFEQGAIRISFGTIVSGYGDWGGGFDKIRSYACKIWIDQEMNILDIVFDSFYNSPPEDQKRSRDAEMYFLTRKYKKLWVNQNSNLFVNIQLAFDEFAGFPGCIPDNEFNYEILEPKELAESYTKNLGGMCGTRYGEQIVETENDEDER